MTSKHHRGDMVAATLGVIAAALLLLRLSPRRPVARLSRRRFLLGAAGGATTVALTACGGGSGKSGGEGDVTIARADVPAVDAAPFTDDKGGFYVVQVPDGVLALSWTCTHQGCKVSWQSGKRDFHCPCHGSTFAYDGVVTHGPAPRPLDLFPVQVRTGGQLVVNTDKKVRRTGYSKDQAVPYAGK